MNTTQLQTLKAAILADQNLAEWVTGGNFSLIRDYLNADSAFVIWHSEAPMGPILDAIDWAKLTPADAPDDTQTWTNRALACQGKQFNIQLMTTGRASIDGTRGNTRTGLNDALSNVPSGPAGAMQSAGAAAARIALQRKATIGEAVFATGTGTVATPGALTFKGRIAEYDVIQALTQV